MSTSVTKIIILGELIEWIKIEKILITGATGFLGRHTVPILRERYGIENVICVSSRDYDLMNPLQVNKLVWKKL